MSEEVLHEYYLYAWVVLEKKGSYAFFSLENSLSIPLIFQQMLNIFFEFWY